MYFQSFIQWTLSCTKVKLLSSHYWTFHIWEGDSWECFGSNQWFCIIHSTVLHRVRAAQSWLLQSALVGIVGLNQCQPGTKEKLVQVIAAFWETKLTQEFWNEVITVLGKFLHWSCRTKEGREGNKSANPSTGLYTHHLLVKRYFTIACVKITSLDFLGILFEVLYFLFTTHSLIVVLYFTVFKKSSTKYFVLM